MSETVPRYSYVIDSEWINNLSPEQLVGLFYGAAFAAFVVMILGYKIFGNHNDTLR